MTDVDGNPTGRTFMRDSREKIPEGLYHVVVEIWVTTKDGRVLLTRRHPNKFNGLKWETTCGSALAGETPRRAAVRELSEEVGICVEDGCLVPLGRVVYHNFITESFHLTLDQPLRVTMQESEVVDARYVPIPHLTRFWRDMSDHSRRHFKLYERVLSKCE